jgi:hypothetical protein
VNSEEHEEASAPDTSGLAEVAERVSGDAHVIAEQLAGIRAELAEARAQADADIAAAKRQAALDVAAERRDRRHAAWKFALVVLVDVVLSGVSLGLYVDQRATESKLHETQVAVLCPLYRLFAQAIQAPRVGETDQQRAVRLAAAKPIRDGYTTLGCRPPLSSG